MANNFSCNGFIAPIAVLLLFTSFLIGVTLLKSASNIYSIVQNDNLSVNAQLAADAGIDDALQSLSNDPEWIAPTTAIEIMNESGIRTTYQLSLSPGPTSTEKILRSTGRVYFPSTDTVPKEERAYEVIVTFGSASGPSGSQYSLVAGPGGLSLSGGAKVSGDIYVGGTLSLVGGSSITTGNDGTLQVGDFRCPIGGGATYPRLCAPAETSQPISVTVGASIVGTVIANNQTNNFRMSSPGLIAGSVDYHKIPPPPDRGPIKSATTGPGSTAMTGSSAGCSSRNKIWPANTKITGNVTISGGCTVTVQGDVWITGYLRLQNSGTIIVSSSLTSKPTIMIDGRLGLETSNNSSIESNSAGIGARFVTYYSEASCSPDCTEVTGADLYNSSSVATIRPTSGSSSDGNEFIAAWTAYNMSGGSSIKGSIAAQRITLTGGADIGAPSYLSDIGSLGASPSSIVSSHSYRRVY